MYASVYRNKSIAKPTDLFFRKIGKKEEEEKKRTCDQSVQPDTRVLKWLY